MLPAIARMSVVLVAVATAALFYVGWTPADAAAEVSADPNDDVHSLPVISELCPDQPLRLAVSGSLDALKPSSVTKLFFASQPVYMGRLSQAAVDAFIRTGRADVLEHRLAKAPLERLRAKLADFDQAMRDLSLLFEEEKEKVKAQLRRRPDRTIRIRTRPRERDPAYLELLAARGRVSKGRGAVWESIVDGEEIHVIVNWDEWPALKAMRDDRFYMLDDRERRVRNWIADEYRVHGLSMFDVLAPAPGRGGSPTAKRSG